MTIECDQCGQVMKTEGGLRLHLQVFHKDPAVKVVEEPKVTPKATKVKPAKVGVTKEVTADHAEFAKKQLALYEAVKKRWPKKPTDFAEGGKVKRSELIKIFPAETSITVVGSFLHKPLAKVLETNYLVDKIIEHKTGWKTVRLKGKKTLVTWREGEVRSKYRFTFPTVSLL